MSTQKTAKYPELAASFNDVKSYFIYAGLFSAAVNLLMLVPVIYMLQVYDRVMVSQNDLTLIAALSACEMGLKLSGVKLSASGVQAAMDYFSANPIPALIRP